MPKKKPENLLHDTHIRLPQDAYDDMMELAKKYHKPFAWVVRLIVTDSLRELASYSTYVDKETGERVQLELEKLNNTQSEVKRQIRAIGYNVNQIARESHENHQAMMSDQDVEAMRDSLDSAMKTYMDAAEEAGKFKWKV